jgi:hypothetical protein
MPLNYTDIKVVTFDVCNCDLLAHTHLSIGYRVVRLLYGKAVSVSYTWGEFNRRPVTIGHNHEKILIDMELGEEWPTQDVVTTPARIYREHSRRGGCWIDQRCILQHDRELRRKAVMRIPTIFRTFGTVIMMCGKPCKCFATLAGLFLAWRNTLDQAVSHLAIQFYEHRRRECCNLHGMSSYFDRLWTRQEFLYSPEISIVWSSSRATRCRQISRLGQPGDSSRYTRLLIDQFGEDDIAAVRHRGERFLIACADTLSLHSGRSLAEFADDEWASIQVLFLLGNPSIRGPSDLVCGSLHHFLWELQSISEEQCQCSARDAIDYVTALWADCLDYELPKDYKSGLFQTFLKMQSSR